ncbi:MAG: transcriptional regulator TrmB [Candidatus Berkelbacteria bacterium]|nr:transcriptional regulator TrmB [Candidatus Berkelbacteria bacterium]
MEKELKNLGLGENEIEVYLAILELGQANVLDMARKAQVPRATVYGILEKLISEGLISSIIKGKRRYYYAEDPAVISKNLAEKEKRVAKILPGLQLLYQSATSRPLIRYYEGKTGVINMLDDIFKTVVEGGTYDALLNHKDEFAILGKKFDEHVNLRKEKRIFIRLITEQSEITKKWKVREKADWREIRYIPRGQRFSVTYHIYGNKVSMFSLLGPVVGVIIENKEIADMERLQFEYMWRGLKK